MFVGMTLGKKVKKMTSGVWNQKHMTWLHDTDLYRFKCFPSMQRCRDDNDDNIL